MLLFFLLLGFPAILLAEPGVTFTHQSPILRASDAQSGDQFGFSTAISGDTLVIGANWSDDITGTADLAGSVYVFTRSGSSWTQQQILYASDGQAGDEFGFSVAISGDTIVVGAPEEDGGSGDPVSDKGAAYVFTRSGGTWSQQQILSHSNGRRFGAAVAIDGDTIGIGADNGSGIVHVFTGSGSNWNVQASLISSDRQNGDRFGNSIALDGDTIVAGAYAEDGGDGNPRSGSGAAYVFVRSGTSWAEQQILRASDAKSSDYFSESVAVDGDTIAVGAIWEDGGASDPITDSGAVYLFNRSAGIWQEQQILRASDAQGAFVFGDNFGAAVALDGNVLVVGAHYEDGGPGNPATSAGAAYVFCYDGSVWSEEQIIRAPDPNGGALFGYAAAIDGATFVVGGYKDSWHGSTRIDNAGEAAVYFTDELSRPMLEQWRIDNFGTSQNSGTSADDYVGDDGFFTNLERYAFNLTATERVTPVESDTDASGAPRFYFDHAINRLVGRYVRRKASLSPQVEYIIEVSDDLTSWTTSSQSGTATSLDSVMETVEWTDEDTSTKDNRFVRLRITR